MPYTRLVVSIVEICKLNHDEKNEFRFIDDVFCADQFACTAS